MAPTFQKLLLAGLAGMAVGGAAVGGFHALRGDADMKAQVREALLAQPEMIPEAMERLQQRESAAVVSQHRAALETPFASAWAGAADGDVVLVEFFDYACGFCRTSNPAVDRLLAEDPRLKVVWRELPVLGPDSEQAAIASLAAAQTGKFKQFHEALFAKGRLTAAAIASTRAAVGLPEPELTPAFRSEIEKNIELARAIRASGTPTFVVGDQVLQGAVGYEALKQAVADARAGA